MVKKGGTEGGGDGYERKEMGWERKGATGATVRYGIFSQVGPGNRTPRCGE